MKWTNLWMALLAVSLLGFTACKKESKPLFQAEGVTIDMQKIYDLQKGTSQDVQNQITQLQSFIRYGQYVQALAVLDKIAADPSLSPAQKKEADDLLGQVKQLAQKAPARQ